MRMGSPTPIRIGVDAVRNRFDRSPELTASLAEVGFHSAAELLGIYAAHARGTWVSGWPTLR